RWTGKTSRPATRSRARCWSSSAARATPRSSTATSRAGRPTSMTWWAASRFHAATTRPNRLPTRRTRSSRSSSARRRRNQPVSADPRQAGDLEGAIAQSELVEYQSGSVVSRTLIKKSAGTVTAFAFDAGEGLSEHTAPYDALVLAVDGTAEISIAG